MNSLWATWELFCSVLGSVGTDKNLRNFPLSVVSWLM